MSYCVRFYYTRFISTDQYILNCIEEGLEPYEYIFGFNDLRVEDRRDSAKEFEKSIEKQHLRIEKLEDIDNIENTP